LSLESFDHVDVAAQSDPERQLTETHVEEGRTDAVHRHDVMQLVLRIIQDVPDGDFRSSESAGGTVRANDVHPEDQIFRERVLKEGEEIRYAIHEGRVEGEIGALHSRGVGRPLAPDVPAYVDVAIAYILFFRDFCDLTVATIEITFAQRINITRDKRNGKRMSN